MRLSCYVASLRPHRGVGPSLLPLLSAPRAAVVRLSYYAARLRPLATPACPSFIAAQLSSHASCSRALILTSGTPAIALRRHSSFSLCRATRPPRAAALRCHTIGVAPATALRRQLPLYCPRLSPYGLQPCAICTLCGTLSTVPDVSLPLYCRAAPPLTSCGTALILYSARLRPHRGISLAFHCRTAHPSRVATVRSY